MSAQLFDEPYYIDINEARWRVVEQVLDHVASPKMRSCLDVGAGPGWFTDRLCKKGMKVTALEGRPELVSLGRQRVPEARFLEMNVERADQMEAVEPADFVLCFGLLYHVENPFCVIRSLGRLARRLLLLETILVPGTAPIAQLVDEGQNATQGLTYCSFIPSKAALLKMLQRAGFSHLYEWSGAVDHQDFIETPERHRRRGIFAAAHEPLHISGLTAVEAGPAPKPEMRKF